MSAGRVVIVGGGISGLATAYYLGQHGIQSLLIEKSNRLGGLIKTDSVLGCLLEAGPDSYIATKPAATKLAKELALDHQIISSNDAARRIFIVRSGKLVPLPAGMTMMVPGQLLPALKSELFSLDTKRRFLTERFRAPRERAGDISVGELVSDHFGQEVLDYVADPLLVGVYGGETQDLSAASVLPRFVDYERRYGSLIKGVRQERRSTPKTGLFLSFADGMQSLTDGISKAIARSTRVIHGEASAVHRKQGSWEIELGQERLSAENLVLACPARVSGRLLENSIPKLAAILKTIPYSSAILVTLLYKADEFTPPLNGFGFLVPKRERRTVAAATWINSKFPSRIAAGWIAIRAFIVGADANRLLVAGDAELVELVKDDLGQWMGIESIPEKSVVYRWPESMPQYVVGHKVLTDRVGKMLLDHPGLHLIGNAFDGIGIPDCIRLAEVTAARLSEIKSI